MIASIGESLIDRVNGKELLGGCPFNVAIAAARLGAAVTYYGKMSSDEYGSRFLERMIDCGVIFDPDLCNAPEPTLCSEVVTDDQGRASYVFRTQGTAASSLTQQELETSLAVGSDTDIVFFGSIAMLMSPIKDAILPAIHGIKSRPKYFFDPNIRPSLSDDPEAYRNMVLSILGGCEVVKMSDEDVAFLMPGLERSVAEQRLAGLCEWNLIVTHGSEGSSWYTKSFRVDCPPVKVESIVDTIGCGDTFSAAVLAYLQSHDLVSTVADLDKATIEAILAYASKAAALNCQKEGCDPPYGDEL